MEPGAETFVTIVQKSSQEPRHPRKSGKNRTKEEEKQKQRPLEPGAETFIKNKHF